MGSQSGSGFSASPNSFSQFRSNLKKLIENFPVNAQGNFGEQGNGARNITAADPAATAKRFYEALGKGGAVRVIPGKGEMRWFEGGTHVTYRPVSHSLDKSPAIEITVASSGTPLAAYQKIHFVGWDI